jgi:NAD(P)-dependent dehydrogenase (short-subunit alcohol dehydrogenase family)
MSANRKTGRVAVVTGASSGIGEATARALAADGHRVALLARRADRIQALADELGNGAIAIEADVTDRESIVAAAERVQQELGGGDILVNNAGRHAQGALYLGPARRAPAHGRDQPAGRDGGDGAGFDDHHTDVEVLDNVIVSSPLTWPARWAVTIAVTPLGGPVATRSPLPQVNDAAATSVRLPR